MKRLVQSAVWMAAALLATALVGVTVAEEPANGNLQGSWNDYPAKHIANPDVVAPGATPSESGGEEPPTDYYPVEPQPPAVMIPPSIPPVDEPLHGFHRPRPRPPQQQQQGKPSGGGGFAWGGKTGGGGSFGGKDGGGFNWGKTRPPQSQQGAVPGGGQANPNQDRLLEYIRQLQIQNAQLRALLQQLVEQQGMSGGRSPGLTGPGVPMQ